MDKIFELSRHFNVEGKIMKQNKEQDFVYKINIDVLLKFHPLILSGISLVSVICYFIYFGLFVGHFPALSGSDVFYFGGLIFFIIVAASMVAILPIFLYPEYYKTKKKFKLIFAMALPSVLIYTFFLLNAGGLKWLYILVAFTKALFILFLVWAAFKIKECFNKNLKLLLLAIIAVVIVLVISRYLFSDEIVVIIINLLLLSYLMNFIVPLGFLFYMEGFYNIGEYKVILFLFIAVVPLYFMMALMDEIVKQLELGNVDYKYLLIEKNSVGALPKGIYDISEIALFENKPVFSYIDNNLTIKNDGQNNTISNIIVSSKYIKFDCEENKCKGIKEAISIKYQDKMLSYTTKNRNTSKKNNFTIETTAKLKPKENITYAEKHGDTVWLHNIKALSTLGKFYYLETKDGVKFELDASKIISREKQER
jgi:putative membrane protein